MRRGGLGGEDRCRDGYDIRGCRCISRGHSCCHSRVQEEEGSDVVAEMPLWSELVVQPFKIRDQIER